MAAPLLSPPTFQQLIQRLNAFWAEQGCVLIQPLDLEVGAGTFHPATFLRALGPEPWNAAYVQPSRRPTDGRYGENPNRLQRYYQYQVVMKPNPDNIQELYLGSLKALGIDPRVHDLRFVEDNWESPTLGAWGLGWEVWLNGMEVTQFTYFQQAGGLECKPVLGEITYGLERLCMYLQNVDNVFDLVSRGIVVDRIALTAPSVRLVRDGGGWNVSRLVKRQRREADREGPGRPVSLPSIAIVDGAVTIDDRVGSTAYRALEN